jgi:hypothetical protein
MVFHAFRVVGKGGDELAEPLIERLVIGFDEDGLEHGVADRRLLLSVYIGRNTGCVRYRGEEKVIFDR